jgi:DNA-binding MarR family transcriptional regulator
MGTQRDRDRLLLSQGLLLHFFANLSLTADVEEPLYLAGLGRPHHRILFFAEHAPGITVSELLDAMHVSHQNLRLPMKKLVNTGYLLMKPGVHDRRQRQLFISVKGRKLVDELKALQWERIGRAFMHAGPAAVDGFMKVHAALLDPKDTAWVERLMEH